MEAVPPAPLSPFFFHNVGSLFRQSKPMQKHEKNRNKE
jgi:hypothetical protein